MKVCNSLRFPLIVTNLDEKCAVLFHRTAWAEFSNAICRQLHGTFLALSAAFLADPNDLILSVTPIQ